MSLLLHFRRHWFALAFVTGVVLWLTRNFFSAEYPAGTDMLGWLKRPAWLAEGLKAFNIWDDRTVGGVRMVTLESLLAMFTKITGDPLVSVKAFIILSLLLAGVSMYFLVFWYTRRRVAGLVAAFIFVGNQFIMSQIAGGHLDFVVGYSLLPLLVFVYHWAISHTGGYSILPMGLLISVYFLFTRIDILIHVAVFLTIFSAIWLAFAADKVRMLVRLLTVAAVSGVSFLSFSAVQLLPTLFGLSPSYVSTSFGFSLEALKSGAIDFGKNLLGMAQEPEYLELISNVSPTEHAFLSEDWYYRFMLLVPLIAFAALIFRKKDKFVLSFALMALAGIFVATGPYQPFGDLFVWVFDNVPFIGGLRQPSRLMTLVYLSYAFLSGVAISQMFVVLEHARWRIVWKAVAYAGTGIVILLVMLSIIFASWYPFSRGLLTWFPDKNEIAPHLQLAKEKGDFRVVTAPWFRGYMAVATPQDRYNGAGTGERLEHDIGSTGSLWSNKPLAFLTADKVWHPDAQAFANYSGALIRTKGTNNLLKVLGAFNVKYLVMQGYEESQPQWTSGQTTKASMGFFRDQKGLEKVSSFGNAQGKSFGEAALYRNQYWLPRIFGTTKNAVIVGGPEAFTALTALDGFDLSQWSLFFAKNVAREQGSRTLLNLIDKSDVVVFVNSEPLDLAMLFLQDGIFLKPVSYARRSATPDDIEKEWVAYDWYNVEGKLVFNQAVLRTAAEVALPMKLEVKEPGKYELWARVAYDSDRGELNFSIDTEKVGTIVPQASVNSGFKWTRMGAVNLDRGMHQLTLANHVTETDENNTEVQPAKINDVDEVVLVKPEALQASLSVIERIAEKDSPRLAFLLEGAQLFRWVGKQPRWELLDYPYVATGGRLVVLGSGITQLQYPLPESTYQAQARFLTGKKLANLKMTVDGRSVLDADLQRVKLSNQSIVYDGEADFWQNYNPVQVALSVELAPTLDNALNSALKVKMLPGREYFSLLGKKINAPEDWSQGKALILAFKGTGSGVPFNLEVFFGGSENNRVLYSFVDNSQDWREFFFDKDRPPSKRGEVNWEKVSEIRISIDDKKVAGIFNIDYLIQSDYEAQETMEEVRSSSFDLPREVPVIEMNSKGDVQLDQLAFYNIKAGEAGITLRDIFRTEEASPVITYEKKSPTRYVAHVKTTTPFYLVFSDSYHNRWRASVGKEEIRPIITDSFVNGFYLTQTGEYDVTIVFTGQRYMVFGGIISLLSVAAALTYPIYRRRLPGLRRRGEEIQ
ncbi:MAG: hypothetical protein HYX81_02205 [Chloroflexi bacterium]|nr:hypothetical protein [Chloroflexota bacterium]